MIDADGSKIFLYSDIFKILTENDNPHSRFVGHAEKALANQESQSV